MHLLTAQSLKELALLATPPCLTIYQPTHRSHPDNRQDPLRFRQHVAALAAALGPAYSAARAKALLAPFDELASNETFWNHTLDGLAVMGAAEVFRVFVLPRPLSDQVLVADSFDTQALQEILDSDARYQVLCLSRDKARLFEGNRDALLEVNLPSSVPRTATEALGDRLTEAHQTVSSHGGIGHGHSALVHSSGGKKDEVDLDTDRYFRLLDRALIEHCSTPTGLPLLLVALPEHHHRFRQASHNTQLLPKGLEINPDALNVEALRQRAWEVVAPQYPSRSAH